MLFSLSLDWIESMTEVTTGHRHSLQATTTTSLLPTYHFLTDSFSLMKMCESSNRLIAVSGVIEKIELLLSHSLSKD